MQSFSSNWRGHRVYHFRDLLGVYSHLLCVQKTVHEHTKAFTGRGDFSSDLGEHFILLDLLQQSVFVSDQDKNASTELVRSL